VPSPDVSPYVDLTLFDVSSQQVYLDALRYARIALPEWEPVEGSIENVLLQAMALEVQNLVTSINRLPGGVVQALLGILGIPRVDGDASTGTVKITSSVNRTVELGSGLRFYYSGGTDPLIVATTDSVTLTRTRQLSSLSRSAGGIITATTSTYHGLTASNVGENVTIATSVAAASAMNGTWPIASVTDGGTTLTLTASGSTINAVSLTGTESSLEAPSSLDPYGFVEVSTVLPGYYYIEAGTTLSLLSSVRDIATVSLFTDLDGGRPQETDSEYFQRASAALSRMTSALVTAEQMAQYVASEYTNVYRVKAIDTCTLARVENTPGDVLIVGARIGATPSNQIGSTVLSDIATDVAERSHASLTIATDNALLGEISVTATIHVPPGLTSSTAELACITALDNYLNPDSWDWSDVVRVHEVLYAIRGAVTPDGVPAVGYVTNVSIAITDINANSLSATGGSGGLYGETTFSGGSITSNVLTIPAVDAPVGVDDYIVYKLSTDTTYRLAPVQSTGANTLLVPLTASNGSGLTGQWAPIALRDGDDLAFFDPAPLMLSGAHTINTV
jgi:hypothetical protein